MQDFRRYAVYWVPPGDWAEAAAHWLGWDPLKGVELALPALGTALDGWTEEPRKYGFHGTIKAPFRLAHGWDQVRLSDGLEALCAGLAPTVLPGLALRRIGAFLALTAQGDAAALMAPAAEVVGGLDAARAPLTAAEVQRRRPERLTPGQRALLDRWGYPYVIGEFQFHLMLSGRLAAADPDRMQPVAKAYFAPHLPRPFVLGDLCLFAEALDGRFHLIRRYPLAG